jgi:hypothetical protein
LNVRPGLVEDQNIEPKTLGELGAGKHLLRPIKVRNFRGMRPARERFAVWQQVRIFAHVAGSRRDVDPTGRRHRRLWDDGRTYNRALGIEGSHIPHSTGFIPLAKRLKLRT